jgi:hypothetical protein
MKRIAATGTLFVFFAALFMDSFFCVLCAPACDKAARAVAAEVAKTECNACCHAKKTCPAQKCSPKEEPKKSVCIVVPLAQTVIGNGCSCKRVMPHLTSVSEERRHSLQRTLYAIAETWRSTQIDSGGDSLRLHSQPQSVHSSIATTVLRL